jgi:2,5-diketo-D-gluconate reductase A
VTTIPTVELNDGTLIPQLGFGTWGIQPDTRTTPEHTAIAAEVVGRALEVGYRHLDTAQKYGTETGVGRAIAASGIARDDLYVTSKLWVDNFEPAALRRSYDTTLEHLGLEELDLFLIHWPETAGRGDAYVAAWRTMTELVTEGRLRSAGVSNFMPHHLDALEREVGVKPAVNQIEIHPHFANTPLRHATWARDIAVAAWSPLSTGRTLFDDEALAAVGERHGKSIAQVALRWHLDQGHIVVPRTVVTDEMRENLDIFDFELSADDTAVVDGRDRGEDGRIGPHPDTVVH